MARTKKTSTQDTINIKSLPVQAHIGASKYVNNDWGTIAFIIPRNQLQLKFADPELRYNCIYFLFGFDQTAEKVYVGQAKKRNNGESVLARLREHDTSTTEKYCDTWEWAVVCTGKEDTWSLDDLNALEHAFYNEIPINQNLNGNNPNSGGANYEAYTDKIRQIKNYITSIGFNLFADNEDTEKIQVTSEVNENTIVEDLQNGLARIPEIVTPHKVVKAMCDILPSEVWNDQTVFLDPACKGGEYLREIYDRLMDCEILQSKYPDEFERSNHILGKQLYGIALSQVSLERTTKKLRGYDHNIRVIPNYIRKLKGIGLGTKSDGTPKTIKDILNEEFNRDMKIDVVIGNPPYQENNSKNGRQAKSLYDKFIDIGIEISNKLVVLVTNNTFLTNESKRDIRNKMIQNGLSKMYNYTKSGELFNGVGVSACIFVVDKKTDNKEFEYIRIEGGKEMSHYKTVLNDGDIIVDSKFDIDILKKCIEKHNMGEIVLGAKIFGIASNGRIGFTGKGGFINYSIIPFENCITLKNKSITEYGEDVYVDRKDIPCGLEYINMYKVMCPLVITKNNLNTFNKAAIFPAGYASTDGWTILGASTNRQIAENLLSYIKTKTFKIVVRACCSDGMSNITKVLMKHVPLPDLTSNSDIEWSQPISNIDQQLYKKYGLTQEEIDYIESTIKPMS